MSILRETSHPTARALGKTIQQIHYELKELEKEGLVESEQNAKEKRKYYRISEYAKMIFEAINQATKFRPEQKLEKWKLKEFLDILEDENLSENLRLSYAESFHSLCLNYAIEVISHEKVRSLFEKVVKDPLANNVFKDLMRSVSAVLPHASRHGKWGKWVLERLYPVFVKSIEEGNEEVRLWAIRNLGVIAVNGIEPWVKGEVEEKLFKIWFSKDTDPNSEFGKKLLQQIRGLFSKRLLHSVKEKAKDQEQKTRAEILLESLKEFLTPR